MSFNETIREAVADFAEHGYRSQEQLDEWMVRLRRAAVDDLVPESEVEAGLRRALGDIYTRLIINGGVVSSHPGISRMTIEQVKPAARAELSRAVHVSVDLIKLDRQRAVEETLQRFTGWASSIPDGGSSAITPAERRKVQKNTAKSVQQVAYEQRRVAIDQGHKLAASISRVVADASGAIVALWHQHYTRYPRKDHTERNGRYYLIRAGWAYQQGYAKPSSVGFFEDITKPGEEILCRCTATYYTTLRRLPRDMLTEKGVEYLETLRRKVA